MTERVRELFFDDGKPAGVHLCTACGKLYDLPEYATCCSPKFCACGAPQPEHRLTCDACEAQREAEAEAARWAAAAVRSADGYDDPVYIVAADGRKYPCLTGWRRSLAFLRDALDDHCFDHQDEPLPELHVYATKACRMKLDAHALVENALDDFYEDAIDDVADEAQAELQALLDAWIAKHSPVTYDPDFSTKIVGWEDAP